MADRIFDPDTFTPSAQDFDGSWHTFGVLAELDEPCDLVGGSVWFPNPKPANFRWVVYRVSDEALIAEVDLAALAGTSTNDWNDFTSADFETPGDVALDDAETYVVAYATNGDFTYRDTGLAFPYGTGIVGGVEGRFINSGSGPEFPDSGTSGFVFPADMIVEAGGAAPVAAAGTAIGIATSTAGVRKVGNAGGCAQGGAFGTVTAGKRAVVAGLASAIGTPRVTSVKVSPASGATSAVGAVRATAVKVANVAGSAVAVPGAAVQAKKVVAVSGTCTGLALGRRAAAQTPGRHVATTAMAGLAASAPTSRLTATTGP